MGTKLKLRPGKCANPLCTKWLRTQKLWCSIECQIMWETEVKAGYTNRNPLIRYF